MSGPTPRFKLVGGYPVELPVDETLVDKARRRFAIDMPGRVFAYEPGSTFLRYPEPVLTRWGRKSPWRNVKP